MFGTLRQHLQSEIDALRNAGLYKQERVITSPQGARIGVRLGEVLNFCANNYLGLGNHPSLVEASRQALSEWGYGMSSVRFICGTQAIHKDLEAALSKFLGTEDTILYTSCFDANGGLFETLFGADDAIITDELNHASIIDGIRLSKAVRHIYKHADMADLERRLTETSSARFRVIATDGVFSMDGDIAKLDAICDLADRYDALVMVDDSHATGFIGRTGRGSAEHCGVMGRVDIITSTLGKALGGSAGGFTSSRREIIEMLRQRSRPYIFSNTMAPPIVAGGLKVLELLSSTTELRDKLESNTLYFRRKMTDAGFDIKPGVHPIVPIMLYDAPLAQQFASRLLDEGIYVVGFFFPVVPKGQARIRVQISAAHDAGQIDHCVAAFNKVGRELGVLKS
ncbi:MAG: glycine C-acetyltransferase [Calditrichaeota bacterium]|nr:glycine C-acetyltransferase [Calditrichota bacterium]